MVKMEEKESEQQPMPAHASKPYTCAGLSTKMR
jgi:hypothetical protein